MNKLKPFLITAGVVIFVIFLVFRVNPLNVRKALTGA